MRPTIAEIDLEAIRHNIRQIRTAVGPSSTIAAVVKADAYGHGAIQISKAALEAGADALAVAIPEEGIELRTAGFTVPILVLGLTLPEQAEVFAVHNLTAAVCTREGINALAAAGKAFNRKVRVLLKIDTGMGRIGVTPAEAPALAEYTSLLPGIELRGVFTHLATADAADKTYAEQQLQHFAFAVGEMLQAGLSLDVVSAANSASIVDLPQGYFNTVRPGIILYGLPPSHEMVCSFDLQSAMTLKTRVMYIKKVPSGTKISYGSTFTTSHSTYLATLPVGYADGYNRQLSNKADVLIGSRRRPVVGRVCMDQIMVDLGPECDVKVGDEAVLFGCQGATEITVTELADLAGTINYELVCAISKRVPRIYINQ